MKLGGAADGGSRSQPAAKPAAVSTQDSQTAISMHAANQQPASSSPTTASPKARCAWFRASEVPLILIQSLNYYTKKLLPLEDYLNAFQDFLCVP